MSKSSEKVKRWRESTKIKLVNGFGGECCICGYSKCNKALELHHLNPEEKEFGFGGARANPKSWIKLAREAEKCVLLCSNCHKEVEDGITEIPEDARRFDYSQVA